MTAFTDPTAPRPEPKRNGRGQYLIPDPETGKERSWTRATTFAGTVADKEGLTKWKQRMTAVGLAARPDLLALVASNPDDKRTVGKVCQDAMDAAGSSSRANLGTALHSMTETIDLGGDLTAIPDAHRPDVAAYRQTMTAAGITIRPEHIERIVCLPELGVAGTFDRLVTGPSGVLRVADLKTGTDLRYAFGEIAIQLALYANATSIWNLDTQRHEPMPEVDRSQALVMHLPAGEARCDLYLLDIAAGWEMVQVCAHVRKWRSRRDLATLAHKFAGEVEPPHAAPAPVPAAVVVPPPRATPPPPIAHEPFPEPDPAHEKRHIYCMFRLDELPSDLQAIVRGLCDFGTTPAHALTPERMAHLEAMLTEAEHTYIERTTRISAAMATLGPDLELAALSVIGVADLDAFTAWELDQLELLAAHPDALGEQPKGWTKDHGKAERVVGIARASAKELHRPVPRSAADVLGDPILIAAVATSAVPQPQPQPKDQAA